jgi:hypothetical protein
MNTLLSKKSIFQHTAELNQQMHNCIVVWKIISYYRLEIGYLVAPEYLMKEIKKYTNFWF